MILASGLDTNIRYLPIVDYLRRRFGRALESKSILEVGSGSMGIAQFLSQAVTGVDVGFTAPVHPRLTPVINPSVLLPFESSSFDIVISSDMLEHVSSKDRLTSISEMCRVSKEAVIIAVPTGKASEAHDARIDARYFKVNGERHPFLVDHLTHGLPSHEVLLEVLKESAMTKTPPFTLSFEKNYSLRLRDLEMALWLNPSPVVRFIFYRLRYFALMHRLFSYGSCYRHIYYLTRRDES